MIVPKLWIQNTTLYDPFLDQSWDLSEEGIVLFKKLFTNDLRESVLDRREQVFFDDLQREGLVLLSSKTATWFLTLKCSLSCEHCYQRLSVKEQLLTERETNLILKKLIDWNVEHILFSGGDIFLNPYLFQILRKIGSKFSKINVSLLTNGFILSSNKKAQQELKQFTDWKPFVQLSLYSNKPAIHDEITGIKGSFIKTVESIKFLKQNKYSVLVNVVLMKKNFDTRYEIADFLEKNLEIERNNFNFDVLLFPRINQDNEQISKYSVSTKQFGKLLREEDFAALTAKYLNDLPYCTGARTKIAISPQGDIYPCNMVQERLGNVLEKSIEDILNQSHKAKKFKNWERAQCKKCRTKYCKKCQAFTKREKFDKIYCEFVKIADREVRRRIIEAEKRGFVSLN